MLRNLLERFRRVMSVAEWNNAARDALSNKEFVVESLNELHRVEKMERDGAGYERDRIIEQSSDRRQYDKNRASNQRIYDRAFNSQQEQIQRQKPRYPQNTVADILNFIRNDQK